MFSTAAKTNFENINLTVRILCQFLFHYFFFFLIENLLGDTLSTIYAIFFLFYHTRQFN